MDFAQVFHRSSEEVVEEHCLLSTLRYYKVPELHLQRIASTMVFQTAHYPRAKLIQVSSIIGRPIQVFYFQNDAKMSRTHAVYSSQDVPRSAQLVKVGIFEGHFFPEVKTRYSRIFLRRLDDIEKWVDSGAIASWEDALRLTRVKRSKPVLDEKGAERLNTSSVLKTLMDCGYLEKCFQVRRVVPDKNMKLTDELILQEQIAVVPAKTKVKAKTFFALDFEADVTGRSHVAFLAGAICMDTPIESADEVHVERGRDCVGEIFTWIVESADPEKDIVVFCHHLRYDRSLFEKQVVIQSICLKDNRVYSLKINFEGRLMEIRDSLKLIPVGLSKFNEMFRLAGLRKKGDFILYDYFTMDNMDKRVTVDEYATAHRFSGEEDEDASVRAEFVTGATRYLVSEEGKEARYFPEDGTFDPWAMYEDYLHYDVATLGAGLNAFRENFGKLVNGELDVFESLTLSSFANKFMVHKGAFKDCHSTSGHLRSWLSQSIYGGRVFVPSKFKGKNEGKFMYIDACSLYPAAIKFICENGGFPTGAARVLTEEQCTMDFLNTVTEYTVEITVSEIRKTQRDVPFFTHRTKAGLQYVNTLEEPVTVTVDKQTLLDYVEYHDIEFKINKGVYWSGAGNCAWGQIVQGLFDERVTMRQRGEEIVATLIKLLLNSSYGYCIRKACTTELAYLQVADRKDFEVSLFNMFNVLHSYRPVGDHQYEVKRLKEDKSSTSVKAGTMILAASKHIMNEVFDTASEAGLDVLYTDTDSATIRYDDMETLREAFFARTGRELVGKKLGQFHSDFSFELDGKTYDNTDVWSSTFFAVGKKLYLHVLNKEMPDGTVLQTSQVKAKGITRAGLDYVANENGGGLPGFVKFYERLCDGEELRVPLNPVGKATKFTYDKDNEVSTNNELYFRTIKMS